MKTQSIHYFFTTRFFGCVAAVTLGVGCGKEEIKVYSVPKESAPVVQTVAAAQKNDLEHSSSDPLHWKTPSGWEELAPTSMRIGNFRISEGDERVEVSIISFPGKNVGTELENVNRWRGEVALEPITEKEISSDAVSVGPESAKLYDLPGKKFQTIAAILPRNNVTWFFKMRGDKELVSKSKPEFLALLNSIHFHDGAAEETAVAEKPASTNVKEVPKSPAAQETMWETPTGWKEIAPTAMVLKNFSVGEANQEAKISITRFPGDVGGLLANVNRWRGQISLEPVGANELADLTASIDVLGGKATLVDMKGPDARMIAAVVPREGQTWFYKMMGDDATVRREKEAFVKFVQTVRY